MEPIDSNNGLAGIKAGQKGREFLLDELDTGKLETRSWSRSVGF